MSSQHTQIENWAHDTHNYKNSQMHYTAYTSPHTYTMYLPVALVCQFLLLISEQQGVLTMQWIAIRKLVSIVLVIR